MAREPDWWMHVTPSLPLTEATVEVEGLPIYYRTGGSGPPLLLLHAPTLVGQHWYPFVDELGAHYTLIIPDMPGNGYSPTLPAEGILFSANARVMFALLDALGVECVRGMGFSAGAGIAIHMAAQQPHRVEAIVSIGGAHRLSTTSQVDVSAWRWENRGPVLQERLLARHPGGVDQIEEILAAIRKQPETRDEYEVPSEQLAGMTARTLLVCGDRDGFVPVEHAVEAYRAIPNAMLWIVPGEGHGPPWSSPRVQAQFPGIVHAFFEGTLVES